MLEPHQQHRFLEELDARQDEVLAGLDQLNGRLERLIAECGMRPACGGAPPPGDEK